MKFEDLKGMTLTSIQGAEKESEQIIFTTSEGRKFKMFHYQDCCESVLVEEVVGDVEDLLNTPLLLAEESTNTEEPASSYGDTRTWTFYRLGTIKGTVVIRWLGESNGYYSESVDFKEVEG